MQADSLQLKTFIGLYLRNGMCPYLKIREQTPPKFEAVSAPKNNNCVRLASARQMNAAQGCWNCWAEAIGISERFYL